ncbi:bacterio-opsin activator domain-containing protein [Natrinema sp. 1APR25-10V2]|uniref:bacterio-opsin activator domain-containing protein n=1 Tax=Natrinema sp. 1APR25-10V2 TaxID=2951081 RepID=UPI0028764FCA|nr:bacterio-opsin activator domain-containing protein [Natrinema sp. 1APR25-10V2]MDS0475159.1 helix-turn-helix domain-containing protein [Natrinema sp. 1APR25-10V2]
MTTPHRAKPIIIVTDATTQESHLRARLEKATDRDVRTTPATDALETIVGSPGDRLETAADGATPHWETDGSGSTEADDRSPTDVPASATDAESAAEPGAVIVELECPGEIQTILQRVHARFPTVPTIVAPREGNEQLATVALRADATEYVSTERDEDPIDRVVSTLQSQPVSGGDGGRYHRILANELPDEAFVIGEDGTYLEAKVRPDSADLSSISADELTGNTLTDAFPDQVAAKLQDCIDRAIRTDDVQSVEYEVETADGRRQFEGRVVPIEQLIGGRRAVVWLARDITERVQRERKLRSRQDQLETLNRINAVVRQVIETLVEAPARDAVEREVCEQLVDSELYCGSWIAEQTGDGRLSFRTGAGEATASLDLVRDLTIGCECPATEAARTGELRTANRILEDGLIPDPVREAAREDDVRSAIAVPITHEDATYGVLTVLASRDDAFSERERAGFRLLGETIGFTIMAVKNRQLLFADTVAELEFQIDGGDTFSFDLSAEYGCTCALEWAGTTADGRTFQYVTIEGLDGETVLDEAMAHDSVEECRLIHDGDEGCTIEMRLSESGVRTLANHGATIRDVTVEDGVGNCLVEVSQDADVREIAEALTLIYENTRLIARREVDRPVRTAAERRNRILDHLTDRQLTTLRLAYYGGFFDWPRESTGEEIAEAMDISPPTMHQHLRKGLKAVLGEFFEGDEY